MSKFKVGDTVVRIDCDNGRHAKVGQVATVVGLARSLVVVQYPGHRTCTNAEGFSYGGEVWLEAFVGPYVAPVAPKARKRTPRLLGKQQEVILQIFRDAPDSLSPSDVWTRTQWGGNRWPLTSIRRAITELTDTGRLVREATQKPGLYGKPEHLWRIATSTGAKA
jgi:hypothetical protein